MTASHSRAILWAQWRTLRNFYPRMGVGWTAIVGVIWYGLWIAVSAAASLMLSDANNAKFIASTLAGLLLLICLYWQVVPVLMAASGASLDLKKLQVYPIPPTQLFSVEVFLRITAAVEVFLVLTGAAIGVLRNPRLPKWSIVALIPFIAYNLLLGVGIRDAIARILARRRIREAAFFILILCAALPQILLTRASRLQSGFIRALARESWIGWPWTATSHFIQGQDIATSAAVLAAWCLAAGAFGYSQFLRTLAFDAQAARSRPLTSTARAGILDALLRIPSKLLADPLGVLIEKEIRFLTRSPRFRLVFLMGFTFGLLVWLPVALGRQGVSQSFLGGNYLTVISVYSLLLLSDACFWNSFGFDRSAAQIYFLAPVPFSRVLIAKNICAVFFITLEISIIAVVCGILGMPLTPRALSEAFGVAAVISIFLLSAGNQFSIRQPRGVNPASSFRSGGTARGQAMLFVIYPIAFLPAGFAYLARYLAGTQAAFYGMLAIDAAIGLIIYKLSLDSAVQAADQLKEQMVEALSRGDGPIAA